MQRALFYPDCRQHLLSLAALRPWAVPFSAHEYFRCCQRKLITCKCSCVHTNGRLARVSLLSLLLPVSLQISVLASLNGERPVTASFPVCCLEGQCFGHGNWWQLWGLLKHFIHVLAGGGNGYKWQILSAFMLALKPSSRKWSASEK